ncbi:hypothetical protein [Microbulbifer thermotolerans]|uniref:Lipoprotein n=1 Tax=Microbulbifer thermotolerans TaxID=252514 RepID=A0A143HPC2_MICTH|nr:hypothetical protein [Microbulbifer thermotolerans]AMX03351.1 hypothetical protein A3224_12860 [Microbulbifer thermotolerans]
MRFIDFAAAAGTLILLVSSGCGYLPSEMDKEKKDKDRGHARAVTKPHTVSCKTPARGFRQVAFDDLYVFTGDSEQPFREAENTPAQYDVNAYVWGFDNCMEAGQCEGGDRYWLIGRGPGKAFTTWVVTPQYPRITIQSPCRNRLKIGKRYRFSFSRGELVGFSRR